MKKYKLFKLKNDRLCSPFQNHDYGKETDILGKPLTCNFDDSERECSDGFYATDIDGLIYTNLAGKICYEVEVSGKHKIFNTYKQRYQNMTIIRSVPTAELKRLVKKQSDAMDWDYYHALFPVNPLRGKPKSVTEKEIELLKKWASVETSVETSVGASVWASVGDSVGDSVWDSVWDSVGASVGASVGDSVWDSVGASIWAYISSIFPNIKKWKYIDHKEGINPFQPCIDLWNAGFVPSYDGKTWRLHSGKHAEIVYKLN